MSSPRRLLSEVGGVAKLRVARRSLPGQPGGSRDRAVVLFAALVVISIGALVGTTVIYFSEAERAAADVTVRKTQARAMAWSGVQAVMAELASQRDGLVSGEKPKVTERWTAPAPDAERGPRWGYRIVSVHGAMVQSEMGRLCINASSEEMLEKVGFPKEVAGRIVAAAKTRKFSSVTELLDVEGVTATMLWGGSGGGEGPVDQSPTMVAGAAESTSGTPASRAGETTVPTSGRAPLPLAERLTVFSFDPDVQVGLGSRASEAAGIRRINLNTPWSDRLGDAIERRWDKGVADAIKGMMQGGDRFESIADIVKKMRALGLKPQDWLEGLDALTCSADEYRVGLVDLGTAPAEVLACVPGISEEAAAEIVFRREKLDDVRRKTIVWPVLEGILKEGEFEQACGCLAMRSMQWRVVIEGGVMPTEEGAGASPARGRRQFPGGEQEEAALKDRVVLEAVIDVSSKRARVAYLREVTMLALAGDLAEVATERERAKNEAEGTDIAPATVDSGMPTAAAPPGTDVRPSGLEMDTELDMPDLDMRAEAKEVGASAVERGGEEVAGRAPSGAAPAQEGKDLRVGRWRAG